MEPGTAPGFASVGEDSAGAGVVSFSFSSLGFVSVTGAAGAWRRMRRGLGAGGDAEDAAPLAEVVGAAALAADVAGGVGEATLALGATEVVSALVVEVAVAVAFAVGAATTGGAGRSRRPAA